MWKRTVEPIVSETGPVGRGTVAVKDKLNLDSGRFEPS